MLRLPPARRCRPLAVAPLPVVPLPHSIAANQVCMWPVRVVRHVPMLAGRFLCMQKERLLRGAAEGGRCGRRRARKSTHCCGPVHVAVQRIRDPYRPALTELGPSLRLSVMYVCTVDMNACETH